MTGKWQHCFPQPSEWMKGAVIGSGSFGTVHVAIDTATGSLFVVKSAASDAGLAALDNEADILRGLDSPHVVRCLGQQERSLFFEYMGGGSVSDVMQRFGGALRESVVRRYTRQILQGLDYLHRSGVVHCDIKCKNILVGASGAVKLTDFGCARRKKDGSRLGGPGGTPLWMAPEILRSGELDYAADIWSLGCTVIEMATGRPPWGCRYTSNPMAAILEIAEGHGVPEFPGHFSAEGVDFLLRCLSRDPRKRWSSRKLLDHPFVADLRVGEPAMSPTSVLDVAGYDSDDRTDDEDGDEEDEFVRRIPFSKSKFASENHSEALDGWITVRSR